LRDGFLGAVVFGALSCAGWLVRGQAKEEETMHSASKLGGAAGQLKQGSHAIGVAIQQAPSQTDAQLAATRVGADLNAIVAAAATHSSTAANQASARLVTDILAAKESATMITDKLGAR
jgi:hypothetical protein